MNKRLVNQWVRANAEVLLVVTFVGVCALVAVIAFSTYKDAVRLSGMHEYLRKHLTALIVADESRALINDARLEQSKFAMRGDDSFLHGAHYLLIKGSRTASDRMKEILRNLDPKESDYTAALELGASLDTGIVARQRTAVAKVQAGDLAGAQKWMKDALVKDDDENTHRRFIKFRLSQGYLIRAKGSDFEKELQRTASNGGLIVLLVGAAIMLVLTQRFVKARKAAEDALALSEEQIRSVANNMLDGLLALDRNGVVASANQRAQTMFRSTGRSLVGQNIVSLFTDTISGNSLQKAAVTGTLMRLQGTRMDGETFSAEVGLAPIHAIPNVAMLATVRDITELVQSEAWKRDFVSAMSNDLFLPLTEVEDSLKYVKNSGTSVPPKMLEVLSIAERNTERLLILINDLLDVESLESGVLKVNPAPCQLYEIIQRSLESLTSLLQQNEITVETHCDGDIPLFADRNRLVQVLVNLISNSIKFSPKGSHIELDATESGGTVSITIQDFGRGIPEEAQPTIFERFTQSEADDAKKGTGLGLPICKMIMEAHGGNIDLSSAQGKGTKFTLNLTSSAVATKAELAILVES